MDDKTVGAVRRDLESVAEIPQQDRVTGRDGKSFKARKPIRTAYVGPRLDIDSRFDAFKPHVSRNSGENEWYTPQVFVDAARASTSGRRKMRSPWKAAEARTHMKYVSGSYPVHRVNRYSEAYCQVLEADRVASPS